MLALGLSVWIRPATAGEPLDLPAGLDEALESGPPETVDQLRLLQTQVRRVVEAARPVTVAVELNDSVGSGVIISGDGLVLTAGHVCVEPNRVVWVRFPDNSRVRGLSLGVNHRLDSGLVRITDKPPTPESPEKANSLSEPEWPFVPLAEEGVTPGDWVVGLGQPNGFVEGRAPPVRLGRVLYTRDEAINTDVTLVGGDSGGPLLNLRGEVIGIHSKIGEEITSNYHVPVAAYRRGWDRLLSGRMIGLPDGEEPGDWRPQVGLAARQTEGRVVVTQVFADEPAAQAGVLVGDVLLRIDEDPIDSLRDLHRRVKRLEAFERTPLVVRRGDLEVELEVWLGRRPVEFPGADLTADWAQEGR
ncbi:putative periplasmic serine endoprotease DegP-like precursor [Planctomycetes bacterium MalM25]|nr:putative periplasmic serine endoprotease DegP-like precursor [Planctomycetes bacterium MalM25]